MRSPTDHPALKVLWRAHRVVWRLSGGRLGTRVGGLPVLELITRGRRSGRPRSVLLSFVPHDQGVVVIGSNAGSPRPPDWWRNLEADPVATVRRGGDAWRVRAIALEGEDRGAAWSRAVRAYPGYEGYAATAGRRIPVVLLARAMDP